MTLLMSDVDSSRRTGELLDLIRTYTRLGYTRREILTEQIEVCGTKVSPVEVQKILDRYAALL